MGSIIKTQTKPLADLKIGDLFAVYAGRLCSRRISDCDVDVIKVETTGLGDVIRGPKGASRTFSHCLARKLSIAIDFKSSAGQATASESAKDVDVVVGIFRPGVMKQFGLD